MPNLKGYTEGELYTIATKILKRTMRDLDGGLAFGLDGPTFRMCFPQRYAMIRAIQYEVASRPAN